MTCRIVLALVLLLGACAAPGEAEFAQWDADLRAAGKLRADRAPIDAPYSRRDLVDGFAKVGFGSEFEIVDGDYVALGTDETAPLTRWTGPIGYALYGAVGAEDRRSLDDLAARLSRATGLRIAPRETAPNMMIFVLGAADREAVGTRFAGSDDYLPLRPLFDAWAADPGWPCAAEFYFTPPHEPDGFSIYFAVIYIRAEVTGLSRRSCLEEEIAQSMGLARDDPSLRPSIFNDDEEFALMTEHDEALLRVLYDPRLRPGMRMSEAMPIVRRIVRDMPVGGGSSGGGS